MAVERFINPFLLVIPAPDGINKREVCQVSFFFFFARLVFDSWITCRIQSRMETNLEYKNMISWKREESLHRRIGLCKIRQR